MAFRVIALLIVFVASFALDCLVAAGFRGESSESLSEAAVWVAVGRVEFGLRRQGQAESVARVKITHPRSPIKEFPYSARIPVSPLFEGPGSVKARFIVDSAGRLDDKGLATSTVLLLRGSFGS